MRTVLFWLISARRRRDLVWGAFKAARAAFWLAPAASAAPSKKKSFLQLNPLLEMRVRGRVKRERGYDYPELQLQDASARLMLVRKVLEKQLQLQ